ncbi:taste receptor type 2 member 4-like [Aquarana catesbeiana]|uniref:taste receptor type 2 member 4-like n=1 Tax=Aquarana catesbeiana TaxID=8400 RepID=UPI003CC98BAF
MGIDPYSSVMVACLAVITLEATTGIFMNLFILIVILQKFQKEKSTRPGDKIRAASIVSNIFLTLVLIPSAFGQIFLFRVYRILSIVLNLLALYSISSSLYLTAVFSFFLFIKIVQFKSDILGWAKRKVALVIPLLVVAVEVFSFCSSFLILLFFDINGGAHTNSSAALTDDGNRGGSLDGQMLALTLGLFLVPYFIMAMTTISAAGSLMVHSYKMKKTGTVNTEAYKKSVYRMMVFFTFHTIFSFVSCLVYSPGLTGPWFWTVLTFLHLLSPAHSLYIIYSKPKLRNAWKMMIDCIFCRKTLVQAEGT